MSTLSKVFVILIVVTSFVYLGVTSALFAHRINWKDKFTTEKNDRATEVGALKKTIETNVADMADKDTQIGSLKSEIQNRSQMIEKLENDLKTEKTRNEKLLTELAGLRSSFDTLKSNLDEAQKRNEILSGNVAELQKEKDTAIADRDIVQNKLKETDHNLTISSRNLADLEKQYIGRMKELDELKTQIAALNAAGVRVEDIAKGAKKMVDGRVIAVSEVMNLLIISAGRDSGVEPGMEFTIYRGDKFVGKAIVEKADKDWASCRSLMEFQTDKPQVGDSVSTKVY